MFLRLVKNNEVPLAALIPNLLTTLALCSALASIHFSIRAAVVHAARPDVDVSHYWERALGAILLSAIFDALDGRAARLLRVTSKFGAVLDSLSDFVAFGVAPAIILHQLVLTELINMPGLEPRARFMRALGLAPVVIFALCSGMRLARFTAAASTPKPGPPSNYFVGMPTPAAAGAVLVPAMVILSDTLDYQLRAWAAGLYTLLIAFLMISRIPMFALKRLRVSRIWVAPILVLVGLVVVLAISDLWMTVAGISLAYLLSLPFAVLRKRRVEPMPEPRPEPGPTDASPAV
ncbi:MAG TPA: phosphatidylcholine/phosphatidylserine synthase [Phycisphaerales bacterium]|nr:phosphatidylcholine/phosphatidylserine synthase [Phycisphaerales bacterium]